MSPNELAAAWFASPGARLVPAIADSPHWFGGSDFDLPNCPGCGHRLEQWFLLNIQAVDALRAALPNWRAAPLLGCIDCCTWVGRHDYRVDDHRVELLHIDLTAEELREYGRQLASESPPLSKQYAFLLPIEPRTELSEQDLDTWRVDEGAFVGGIPPWYQEAVEVQCPECDNAMAFIGCVGFVDTFNTLVEVNNGSGHQYHFGCNECRVLSAFSQWS